MIAALNDPTVFALALPAEAWPRRRLSAAPVPDGWFALLQKPDSRRWIVPSSEEPRAERGDRLVLIRNKPLTVPLEVEESPAACGNRVSVAGELIVRWTMREDDAALLGAALGPGEAARLDQLQRWIAPAAGGALREYVRARQAAALLREDHSAAVMESLRAALARFCFEYGATLERLASIRFRSPTLAEQEARERAAAARMAEVRARENLERAAQEATLRRLEGLTSILDKLKAVGGAFDPARPNSGPSSTSHPFGPDTRWHDLLPVLTPAERGTLLQNLWRITPNRVVTHAIALIAGDRVLWLDPAQPDHIERELSIPGDLGGLRSITYAASHDALLVGAAAGVWHVPNAAADCSLRGPVQAAAGPDAFRRFAVPDAGKPRTGFNAAAICRDRLFATHSQLGCWSWPLDGREAAFCVFKPASGQVALPATAPSEVMHSLDVSVGRVTSVVGGGAAWRAVRTVRAATALDGRVLFAADASVYIVEPPAANVGDAADTAWPVRELTTLDAPVHSLRVLGDALYAGTERGAILRIPLDQPDDAFVVHRGIVPIEAFAVRAWGDLVEVVAPGGPQGVLGIYEREGVVSRVVETQVPIRRVWAADDLVVGLTELRDRLLLSRAAVPGPPVEALIARATGEQVMDACLVTQA